MNIVKMSGTGNTFHILDLRDGSNVSKDARKRIVVENCANTLNGADGFIFLENTDQGADFEWDFFNSDGSHAEMCGNASRCVGQFAFDRGLDKKNISFVSGAGIISTEIRGDGFVEVEMTPPKDLIPNRTISVMENSIPGLSVDSGVPHFVFEIIDKSEYLNLNDICKDIMFLSEFFPRNTNVTVVSPGAPSFAATFERGVEDFTQACGTGAVAAGIYLVNRSFAKLGDSIAIEMPGGNLEVRIEDNYKKAFLFGPTEYLGEAEIEV